VQKVCQFQATLSMWSTYMALKGLREEKKKKTEWKKANWT